MTQFKSTALFTLICLSTATVLTGCQPKDTVGQAEDASKHSELAQTEEQHEDHAGHSEQHEGEAHEGEAHEGHEGEAHEGEGHEDEHNHEKIYTTFNCTPAISLSVYYHTDIQPKTAYLLIDGIEYDLTQTNSLPKDIYPGDVYIGNLGLNDNQGLLWQVKDNKATLYEVPVAQTKLDTPQKIESLKNLKPLYQCQPSTAA